LDVVAMVRGLVVLVVVVMVSLGSLVIATSVHGIGVGMAVVHFWKVGRLAGTLETDLWQQESGSSGCMAVACVAV